MSIQSEPLPFPTFVRNKAFGARIAKLAKAYEVMNAGNSGGRCGFLLEDGSVCDNSLDGNHSIQEKILDLLAVRGHVKTFPRDLQTIKNRFIDQDPERREVYAVQRRWPPTLVGVNEASVWRFFCQFHDTQVFRSIERDDSNPSRHPLDETPLTPFQYFSLAHRILLRIREESNGARRAFEMSLTLHERRNKPALLVSQRHSHIAKGLDRAREVFGRHYWTGDFDSFMETPLDAVVELPTKIAVADLYEPSPSAYGLFLTIYPAGAEPDGSVSFLHRVIASRLLPASPATDSTLQTLGDLLEAARQSEMTADKFLAEVLSSVRNAFISRSYEQHLSEHTRTAIEHKVHESVVDLMREWFPW